MSPSPSLFRATVALVSPPFASLTYLLPEYLPAEAFAAGQRVIIPLGKGLRMGVLLELLPAGPVMESGPGGGFVLRPLLWPLEKHPLLTERYLALATQLALRQTSTVGQILGSLLPAGMRTTQTRIRFFGEGKPRELKVKGLAELPEDELARLGVLWQEGRAEVCRSGHNPLDAEVCLLAADPPWPVRPAAKAQTALLEYLFEHGTVSRRKLGEALGKGAAQTLATLAGRGLVRIQPADDVCLYDDAASFLAPIAPSGFVLESEQAPSSSKDTNTSPQIKSLGGREEGVRGRGEGNLFQKVPSPLPRLSSSPPSAFTLTAEQQAAVGPLLEVLERRAAETHLLFGITGSGKTAVYLELARRTLEAGRSVLLLAPEVALALKLRADVAAALPQARVVLFHGYQSPSTKEATFRALASLGGGEPRLVVGTRSALMLPLENIGLIVLDEEHDASFKQDEGFIYQAKEVAWYRAGVEGALLLLGSATPDVKSYHAAVQGKIPLHLLTCRAGGGTLPEVRIVQLPKGRAMDHLLAEESMTALHEVVERGEQAVILLNRRGYAPLMYCLSCNGTAKCPHCDIGLAYHKGRERLLCHYCGYSVPYPSPCASCNGMDFLPMGEGTERLEEHLASALPPGTGILRLDRDSTRRPGRMEEILRAFARKEASVLVGTQMLSKGHHFPDVTLAVAVDADLGLNLPDYRAAERTFQLLLQSAGRSGRGEKGGCVIIQTRDPSHYCWEFVKNADYEGFFTRELALREKRRYPPFVRLALIRISYPMDAQTGADEVAALGTLLRAKGRELGVTVLGPAPAPLPFLKGLRRFHCLVKGTDWQPLRALYAEARKSAGKGHLRIRLDLDPVNML